MIWNYYLNNIFKIKFMYVTNDTSKTSIKNHIYHYTTPCEMLICDSDGVTGDRPHIALEEAVLIFLINFKLQRFFVIQKTFTWSLEFWINQVLVCLCCCTLGNFSTIQVKAIITFTLQILHKHTYTYYQVIFSIVHYSC
jgi:hypothetical protein